MSNRLVKVTSRAKKKREKLFCAFLTLGYPNLKTTENLILEFEKSGVDIVELGFPFSDPLADGPTIQYSSEMALKKGVKIQDAFNMAKGLRKKGLQLPLVFFTYLNPIYRYGLKKFVTDAAKAGFDGVIVPDLPPEEEKKFSKDCRKKGVSQVFLVAPTTQKKRAKVIAKNSQGFIYYVSLRGVTGTRKKIGQDVSQKVTSLRRAAKKPVLIGFGVSSWQQAQKLRGLSEGVIVGSAIVNQIRKTGGKVAPVTRFVRQLVRTVKGK